MSRYEECVREMGIIQDGPAGVEYTKALVMMDMAKSFAIIADALSNQANVVERKEWSE